VVDAEQYVREAQQNFFLLLRHVPTTVVEQVVAVWDSFGLRSMEASVEALFSEQVA